MRTPESFGLSGFVVGKRALQFFDSEATAEFLASIDPDFWAYQADVHSEQLSGEPKSRQRAALALRIAYGHGVETLLALLSAYVQAPKHPLAWLLSYRNQELRDVVRAIHTADSTLLSALRKASTWR